MAPPDTTQKIARLTPLADVLATLDTLAQPVRPRDVAVEEALDRVLAVDVSGALRPVRPAALHDGWAVKADDTVGAGDYAPAMLPTLPSRVETGDEMPPGTDAVAPLDTIIARGGRAEAVCTVAPGDGVLAAGGDCNPSQPLRRIGQRMRIVDIAVLMAADIAHVRVRVPRIRVVAAREDLRLLPAVRFIARDCVAQGGDAVVTNGTELQQALHSDDVDAVVIIGGTGSGGRDHSVTALAQAGRVMHHGIGLTPGDTAALGAAGPRPVVVVPGRLDAALAVWLVIGRALQARLAGAGDSRPAITCTLARKIASTVGLAELVPVRRNGDTVEPLAAKVLGLSVLARSDGFILVPPDSEGYAPGVKVTVQAW